MCDNSGLTDRVAALVERYMETAIASRRYAAPTIKGYRWYLRRFARWLGDGAGAADVTSEAISRYMSYLTNHAGPEGRGYRPRTLRPVAQALKLWCAWLCATGQLPADPMPQLTLPRLDPARRDRTSAQAAAELVAACDRIENPYRRQLALAMTYLLHTTAVRLNELVNIKVSDVALTDPPNLLVAHGKGNKQRRLYLSDNCAAVLREYMAARQALSPKHDYLLVLARHARLSKDTVYKVVRELAALAGHTDHKADLPHAARRGCATRHVRAGDDIAKVSTMLGHTHITTTQIYVGTDELALEASRNVADIPLPGAPTALPPSAPPAADPRAADGGRRTGRPAPVRRVRQDMRRR